jgi:hypothetical protein
MHCVYIKYVTPEEFIASKNDAVASGDHREIVFDVCHLRKINWYAIVFAGLTD